MSSAQLYVPFTNWANPPQLFSSGNHRPQSMWNERMNVNVESHWLCVSLHYISSVCLSMESHSASGRLAPHCAYSSMFGAHRSSVMLALFASWDVVRWLPITIRSLQVHPLQGDGFHWRLVAAIWVFSATTVPFKWLANHQAIYSPLHLLLYSPKLTVALCNLHDPSYRVLTTDKQKDCLSTSDMFRIKDIVTFH